MKWILLPIIQLERKMKKRKPILLTEAEMPKTRVCNCCGKRKKMSQFFDQKPPYAWKIRQHKPRKRRECKKCHVKKTKANWLKTPKKARQLYMRTYMREYLKAA
jgi:hypothetical protein